MKTIKTVKYENTFYRVQDQVYRSCSKPVWYRVKWQVGDQVLDQVEYQVRWQIRDQVAGRELGQ